MHERHSGYCNESVALWQWVKVLVAAAVGRVENGTNTNELGMRWGEGRGTEYVDFYADFSINAENEATYRERDREKARD